MGPTPIHFQVLKYGNLSFNRGKLLGKYIFKPRYIFFDSNYLISNSTVDQLIDFIDEIHKSFDKDESVETQAVFLHISKNFDKV